MIKLRPMWLIGKKRAFEFWNKENIYVYIYIKNIHWAVLSALKELKFVQI